MASGEIPSQISRINKLVETHQFSKTSKKVAAIGVAIATIVAIGAVLAAFLVPGGGVIFSAIALGAGVGAMILLFLFFRQLHSEQEAKDKINTEIEKLPATEWEKLEAKQVDKLLPILDNERIENLCQKSVERINTIESKIREVPSFQNYIPEILEAPIFRNDHCYEEQREVILADRFYNKLNDILLTRRALQDNKPFGFDNLSKTAQARFTKRERLENRRKENEGSSVADIFFNPPSVKKNDQPA